MRHSTQEILDSMSLEEKVGQTIFPAFPATYAAREAILDAVERYWIGGVLLRAGSLMDAAKLIGSMPTPLPRRPIFAADIERGVGERLAGGITFPANLGIGAAGDEGLARVHGEVTAAEARSVGIQLILAPVLDLFGVPESPIVGTRSYGDSAEDVARFGEAFIRGAASRGGATCAKHFPGHGFAAEDSHSTLPVIERTAEKMRSQDLVPFGRAIRAGVDAIMVGHLHCPALDDRPATISPRVIRDLLRQEMGFGGLVVTDALLMGGIASIMTEEDAAVQALGAGADVLLCPTHPAPIHAALMEAVKSGDVPRERLEEAVKRILILKSRQPSGALDSLPAPEGGEGRPYDAVESGRDAAKSLAEASVCLLRNEGDAIPFEKGKRVLIVTVPDRPDPFAAEAFIDTVSRCSRVTVQHLLPGWRRSDRERVEEMARDFERVIWAPVGKPAAWNSSARAGLGGEAMPGGHAVALALGSPGLLEGAPRTAAEMCTFSDAAVSQEAAARAIFGEIPVRGKLPIDCAAGRRGDGLQLG